MFEDLGRASMILGVAMLAMSLLGIYLMYRLIKHNSLPEGGLDKLIELGKWFMVSVALVVSTAIINDGFRERDQDVKEMEVFDKYTTVVLEADGVEKRKLLTEYFASVSPQGAIKRSWQAYKQIVDAQVLEFRETQKQLAELDKSTAGGSSTAAELAEKARLLEKASVLGQKLSNASPGLLKPRVYFHIRTEAQRTLAAQLAKELSARAEVDVPGIQRLDEGPKSTELRYFKRSEGPEAKQIADAISASGTPATATYIAGYEGSTAIRQRHYELWISGDKQ